MAALPATGSEHRFAYDELGRSVADQFYASNVLQWQSTATPTSNTVRTVSPKGVATVTTYDGHGNIASVDEERPTQAATHTTYRYTARQELAAATDTSGNLTEMFYDWLGRRTMLQDPDQGTSQYTYDANGNIADRRPKHHSRLRV